MNAMIVYVCYKIVYKYGIYTQLFSIFTARDQVELNSSISIGKNLYEVL